MTLGSALVQLLQHPTHVPEPPSQTASLGLQVNHWLVMITLLQHTHRYLCLLAVPSSGSRALRGGRPDVYEEGYPCIRSVFST